MSFTLTLFERLEKKTKVLPLIEKYVQVSLNIAIPASHMATPL